MLSLEAFHKICEELGLSDEGKAVIDKIRSSDPVRKVGGGTKNVCGRYPSVKMGHTIQFESHTVELPAIYTYEYDASVKAYYDQPVQLKLLFKARNGRRIVVFHTPDFCIIRRHGNKSEIGFEEWKTEEQLVKLSHKYPERYVRDTVRGVWRCPPGEETASRYGFYYKVRSSSEIDWYLQRNLMLLEDFIYENVLVSEETVERVLALCELKLAITLDKLLGEVSVDEMYALIGNGTVYVDLTEAPLTEPNKIHVFMNKQIAEAVSTLSNKHAAKNAVIDPAPGAKILWNDTVWTIGPVLNSSITLIPTDGEPVDLKPDLFEQFVRSGKIKQSEKPTSMLEDDEVQNILRKATKEDYIVACERLDAIQYYISDKKIEDKYLHIPARTRRYWYACYREAEAKWGDGLLGLLPDTSRREVGARLSKESREEMVDVICNHYETTTAINKTAAYGIYKDMCGVKGIADPASFKTFCEYINNRPRYEKILKREGRKAAYEYEPEYMELEYTTPRHGEKPFDVCYIDHTQLDLEVKDPVTGETFRPWATILQDGYSRRVLVAHIQKDRPDRATCLLVFRKCVARFGRLPRMIVHDGGAEFESVDVQVFLARYRIKNKKRPASKARFGSPQERYNGTVNTKLLHNLVGNTKATKNVRQLYKEIDPKTLAVWTFDAFEPHFEEFCYEVYDTAEHSTLCCSPRVAYEEGMARTGYRNHKLISPNDPGFLALTLPSPRRIRAKVQPRRGIKVEGVYYKHKLMSDPKIENSKVEVKYVPENFGVVLAYLNGNWEVCHSQYYPLFKNKTRKEIAEITKEIKEKKRASGQRQNVSANDYAAFLKKSAIIEAFLSAPGPEVSLLRGLASVTERDAFDEGYVPDENEYLDNSGDDWEDNWEDDWEDQDEEKTA